MATQHTDVERQAALRADRAGRPPADRRFRAGEISGSASSTCGSSRRAGSARRSLQLLPLVTRRRRPLPPAAQPQGAGRPELRVPPRAPVPARRAAADGRRIRLFQAFLDAAVSEQIARMVAMKAATDAAEEMIKTLTRQYNRARQTQITMELLEIIGGANALRLNESTDDDPGHGTGQHRQDHPGHRLHARRGVRRGAAAGIYNALEVEVERTRARARPTLRPCGARSPSTSAAAGCAPSRSARPTACGAARRSSTPARR